MKTTKHATVKDFFKFLGVVIGAIFTIIFFFLRMLGDSKSSDSTESTDLFEIPENDYDNLASTSFDALSNPMNMNHDD